MKDEEKNKPWVFLFCFWAKPKNEKPFQLEEKGFIS